VKRLLYFDFMTVDVRVAPDRVFLNGKIVTMDSDESIAEALAVKGERIIGVGSTEDIGSLIGVETEVVDLRGRTVLPGFIDTHSHPGVAATTFLQINCISPPTSCISEILEQVAEAANRAEPGEWVLSLIHI